MHVSEDRARFFIKKGIEGNDALSMQPCIYILPFYNPRSGVNLSHILSNVKSLFSRFWHIFISRILYLSSETLTQESPDSVALIPNNTRYRKEDLMCTSAVSRAWAFQFPPSHRIWNLQNFSGEIAQKCSIQTSGE